MRPVKPSGHRRRDRDGRRYPGGASFSDDPPPDEALENVGAALEDSDASATSSDDDRDSRREEEHMREHAPLPGPLVPLPTAADVAVAGDPDKFPWQQCVFPFWLAFSPADLAEAGDGRKALAWRFPDKEALEGLVQPEAFVGRIAAVQLKTDCYAPLAVRVHCRRKADSPDAFVGRAYAPSRASPRATMVLFGNYPAQSVELRANALPVETMVYRYTRQHSMDPILQREDYDRKVVLAVNHPVVAYWNDCAQQRYAAEMVGVMEKAALAAKYENILKAYYRVVRKGSVEAKKKVYNDAVTVFREDYERNMTVYDLAHGLTVEVGRGDGEHPRDGAQDKWLAMHLQRSAGMYLPEADDPDRAKNLESAFHELSFTVTGYIAINVGYRAGP